MPDFKGAPAPPVVPTPPSAAAIAAAIAAAPKREPGAKDFLKQFRLEGKVAVVTGGAGGLGFAMSEGLCSVGLQGIAIIDVQSDSGLKAIKVLEASYNVKAKFYKLDIRDEKAVEDTIEEIVNEFGHIDIFLNSAGVADLVHSTDYPIEKFRRVVEINLNGTFIMATSIARKMLKQNIKGSIIFIASMSGSIVNFPNPQSAYNASKAAVKHLAKSLAVEWAWKGIRVNTISPGYMDTPLNRSYTQLFDEWTYRTPIGRLGKPEELVGACLWLASDSSSFCTGSDILIDGGYTCL